MSVCGSMATLGGNSDMQTLIPNVGAAEVDADWELDAIEEDAGEDLGFC